MSSAKPPPDPPSDETALLWQAATKDVRKLEGEIKTPPATAGSAPRVRRPVSAPQPTEAGPSGPLPQGKGLDGRTAQRLAQGKMTIDARLDLHGRTLPEAHAAVRAFILKEFARESRCLLVITGKGMRDESDVWFERERGGIRRQFRDWLADADLTAMVLAVTPARASHGGDGAFYVLLRRKRSISE